MDKFITQEGLKTIEKVKAFGLLRFYDKFMGSLQISIEEYPKVQEQVLSFLKENNDWVMGVQKVDENEFYIYMYAKQTAYTKKIKRCILIDTSFFYSIVPRTYF